jgi:hypothetical protein
MFSTVTLRFLRYLSSILYGCLFPVVRSSMMTTVGPLVLSGFAAGESVEGPMASVSVRFSSARGAGCAEVGTAGCVPSAEVESEAAGSAWGVWDVSVSCVAVVAVAGAVSGAVVVAAVVAVSGAAAGGVWRVRISTGAEDRASWVVPWRSAGAVE